MQRGAARDSPTSRASSGFGTWSKQKKLCPLSRAARCWRYRPGWMAEATRSAAVGRISRSSAVSKATASIASVRTDATSVPAGMWTVAGWGADSQKVTGARAGPGGNRRTPMRSRNFR